MSAEEVAATAVVENARMELLRGLAQAEDSHEVRYAESARRKAAGERDDPDWWPTHYPLFCGVWQNEAADIRLAVRECERLGFVEAARSALDRAVGGPMVRITPAGYAWIRAHDALGEIAQEGAR